MDTNISILTQEIAQHLDSWQAVEGPSDYGNDEDNGWLVHESGAKIHLQRIWNHKERIEVSGSYPRSSDGRHYPRHGYGQKNPEITCAISRGVQAITKDITKRFLPSYLALYASDQQHVAKYEMDKAETIALMQRLGQTCGIPAAQDYQGNARVYGDCGSVWVSIKPYGTETVEIDLREVPTDLALKICQLLREA